MKKIIKITENDLSRIVKQVLIENEKEWIDNSLDMGDVDFSKMSLEKKVFDDAKRAVDNLDDKEKELLKSFIKNNNPKKLVSLVKSELKGEKYPLEESNGVINKIRKILSKLILSVGVTAGIAAVPAAFLISSGISSALTLTTLSLGLLAYVVKPKK